MTQRQNPNLLRDHLANERTFLAWIRTSITVIALGFVVARFGLLLREVSRGHIHPETAHVGAVVGVTLVVAGLATAGLATVRFLQVRRDIERDIVRLSPMLDVALAVMVGVAAVALTIYLVVTA